MRFLAIVPEAFGGFGGIAVYNRDFLTALAELPICDKVTIIPRLIRHEPVTVPPRVELRERGANSLIRYVCEVVRVLSKGERYDVVLCGHINLLPFAVIASRLLRAKRILLIYGIDAWKPTGRGLSDRLVACMDSVISISGFTKQRFLSWSTIRDDQVHLLPNAIHLEEYGIAEKPRYLEQRYGLGGKKVLLTLGRLQRNEGQKGLDEMLEILPALVAEEKDLVYMIAGDGDDRSRLERKAASLGLSKNVVFAGRVAETEKADHYRLADAFVMAGRQEGFGFVFLEAMASGIPVVASSVDGSREAVLDGKLGELADPDDREALKAAIRRALGRPRQIPDELAFFSYEKFRERLQGILADLSRKPVSAT
jgi:phosphatidylinositol alpha-1,6-mannosyltransferase